MFNLKGYKTNVNELVTPTALELYVEVDDQQGGKTGSWAPQTGVIWVKREVRRYVVSVTGGQAEIEDTLWVTMRFTTMVQNNQRWRFNGPSGIWYIENAVDPHDDQRWLVCLCTEIPQ